MSETTMDAATLAGLVGAMVYCRGPGCGRQAKVKRDGTYGAHYKFGKERCRLVGKPVPAGVDVLRWPAGSAPVKTAPVVEVTPTVEVASAEVRLLEKVARKKPKDVVWDVAGEPAVLVSEVAIGTFGRVSGVDLDRLPVTAVGYVVVAGRLNGGHGGWHPGSVICCELADTPGGPVVQVVQAELDARLTVLAPPEGMPAGEPAPWTRMSVEDQILAARDVLGLEVEVRDGRCNELWAVEGCSERLVGEVAWWLFGGRYGTWEGRARPVFSVDRIGRAITAGRYKPYPVPSELVSKRVQAVPAPETAEVFDRLLGEGRLIDGAGRVLRMVKCSSCCGAREHEVVSGSVCPFRLTCPVCEARPVWGACVGVGESGSGVDGVHGERRDLAERVERALAAAGDLSVPAPWSERVAAGRRSLSTLGPVVNDDLHLASLLVQGERWFERSGRASAFADAERYAAGVPLVRHSPLLKRQWEFVCPVPTCLWMFDGHGTVRECRDHWFEHAAKHAGFTATWLDNVFPVEAEPLVGESEEPKRGMRGGSSGKRGESGRKSAVIEVREPVGNGWWDEASEGWRKDGLLVRSGGVASLLISQGYAKACEFAELVADVGGVPRELMTVRAFEGPRVVGAPDGCGLRPVWLESGLFDVEEFLRAVEGGVGEVVFA